MAANRQNIAASMVMTAFFMMGSFVDLFKVHIALHQTNMPQR
jgi:hypothetical protein